MKNLFLSIMVVLMSAAVMSCSDDDEKSAVASLSADQTEVTYSNVRAVQSLIVTSTADWDVSTDVTWITLTKTSYNAEENNIAFTLDANQTNEARTGHIIVTSGNQSLVFTITQTGENVVELSQDSYTISSKGGVLNIRIATNVTLEVTVDEDSEWLTYNQIKDADTQFPTLQFTAAPNTTEDERTATVTIKDSNSDISQTLTVTQKEQTTFEVTDETTRTVDGSESTIVTFNVRRNVDYVEFISDRSWIVPYTAEEDGETEEARAYALTKDNTIAEDVLSYQILANSNYDGRQGTIMITDATSGEVLSTLVIEQSGNPVLELASTTIPMSSNVYTVGAEKKYYRIELNTNVSNIEATSTGSWVTFEKSLGGYSVKFEANATTEDDPTAGLEDRTTEITISDANGAATPLTLTVVQKKP